MTLPSRRLGTWALSIVGAAAFLWIASQRLELWPERIDLVLPWALAAGVALHVPYALVRAMRLAFLLDPVVEQAGARRFDRRVLYGSGLVSFLVLLVLPLKLGELSRPLLLARAKEPGVGLAESVGAVAAERVLDGLAICAMLFGGLALAGHARDLAQVQSIGRWMSIAFAVGLVVGIAAARMPERAGHLASRLCAPLGERASARMSAVMVRIAGALALALQARRALSLVAWTIVYWAITVLQLWLVLRACGIELGAAEAATVVAVVGLSIQLPGGPVQTGTFQLGTAAALSLFLDEAALLGPGSSFAAVMWLLQFAGAAVLALPGALLMAARSRPP
jgi:uncharacterized protein (TIRG00374 family)